MPTGYGQPRVEQPTYADTTIIDINTTGAAESSKVPNYACLAWLTCLFFCWPLGVAAIASNVSARRLQAAGEVSACVGSLISLPGLI